MKNKPCPKLSLHTSGWVSFGCWVLCSISSYKQFSRNINQFLVLHLTNVADPKRQRSLVLVFSIWYIFFYNFLIWHKVLNQYVWNIFCWFFSSKIMVFDTKSRLSKKNVIGMYPLYTGKVIYIFNYALRFHCFFLMIQHIQTYNETDRKWILLGLL